MFNAWKDDLVRAEVDLRDALLWDKSTRADSTKLALVVFLYQVGRLVLHKVEFKLPELSWIEASAAARYIGNKILGQCGPEQEELIARIQRDLRDPVENEYAFSCAASVVDELMGLLYADAALARYRDEADRADDPDLAELYEKAREDLATIATSYNDGLAGESGKQVFKWLASTTNYIANHRAMLPEGVEVPWFLNF